MKKQVYIAYAAITALALSACGNGGGASVTALPPTANHAQVADALLGLVTAEMDSVFNGGGAPVKSTGKALFEQTTEVVCPLGGLLTTNISGDVVDGVPTGVTFNNVDVTLDNAACQATNDGVASDGICSYPITATGTVNCVIDGTDDATGTNLTVDCQTIGICAGMAVIVNGTSHTAGFSASTVVTGDGTGPTTEVTTGTICINGTNYDINAMDNVLATFMLSELQCS